MSNFLDYLSGGEEKEAKETLEDVSTKEILNRMLAEIISLREVAEDLADELSEVKEQMKSVRQYPANVPPLATDFGTSSRNAEVSNNSQGQNGLSEGLSKEEVYQHVGALLG